MKREPITLYAVIQCGLTDQEYASVYHRVGEILVSINQTEEDAIRMRDILNCEATYCIVKPITIY